MGISFPIFIMTKLIGTEKFMLGSTDFGKVLTVALWSGLSALSLALIAQIEMIDWTNVITNPKIAVFAVPLINTLAYTIKQYFTDTRKEVNPV